MGLIAVEEAVAEKAEGRFSVYLLLCVVGVGLKEKKRRRKRRAGTSVLHLCENVKYGRYWRGDPL